MTSLRLCCILLSCTKFAIIASSLNGGGTLPPPPPPPPPPQRSAFDGSSIEENRSAPATAQVLSVELHSRNNEEQSSDEEETTTSKQTSEDASASASYNESLSPSIRSEKDKTPQTESDDNIMTAESEQIDKISSSFGETCNSWGQLGQEQWKQQTYQHTNQQSMSWNQDQHQQPYQSWDEDHNQYQQQPQYYRYQQPHYQQQQLQQQQQHSRFPYPQQQQPPPQQRQPNNQLTLYNRPPRRPTPLGGASSSASRFFSLAVKKLQTGIDSVSETLDTNNLASSVSSLTSRIGNNINNLSGAITGVDSLIKSGGGGRRMTPPQSQLFRPPMQAGKREVGGPPLQQTRQQFSQQQRMGQPSSRGLVKSISEDNYAPPMSELYSLESETASKGAGSDAKRTIDSHEDIESDIEHDATLNDGTLQESTPLPFSTTTIAEQQKPNLSRTPQYESRQMPPPTFSQPSSTQTSRRRYADIDDDDDSTFGKKIKSALGSVPIPRIPKFSRSDDMMFDDGSWSDDEASERSGGLFRRSKPISNVVAATRTSSVGNRGISGKAADIPRPVTSLLEKRDTLLSLSSMRKCKSIGRSQAILGAIKLSFLLCAIRETVPLFLREISSIDPKVTFPKKVRTATLSTIFSAFEGWAPYAIAAAILVSISDSAWIQPTLHAVANEAASESVSDAAYSQLYLRLISSMPMQSLSSEALRKATMDQILYVSSLARLRFFVTVAITVVIFSTVAVLGPAVTVILSTAGQVWRPSLDVIKNSPINWSLLWGIAKKAGLDLAVNIRNLFETELDLIRQEPLRVAVVLSLIGTMMAVSHLPTLENRRKTAKRMNTEDNEKEDSILSLWSNIGSSSSSRLGILSSPRGVEGALQHFSKLRPDQASELGIISTLRHSEILNHKRRRRRESEVYLMACQSLLRKLLYFLSVSFLLSIPLIMYFSVFALVQGEEGSKLSWTGIPSDGWVSLLSLASLLLFTQQNAGNAARRSIDAADSRLKHSVVLLFTKLRETVAELQKLSADSSAGADFQAMMTASPTKGLAVSDFWAAHSSRKAWAIKGANVQVRCGEVVLVIGDDGAGKSRLLTGIAEYIFAPPKSARTTTYARGNISIAGVEIAKWDRKVLQKRVGLFLNDIRTVPDYASLMSGCTLEEIIEPISSVSGQSGAKERNSMTVAVKITGLGSKVLSRLPSKLSTVVSASEDKLKPSPLRPPAYPLSPSEWSRVMLTKVIAQLVSCNENQQSSGLSVKNSMIGSILLLDDASALMNETDEGKLITALRSTGAAILLSSNRWASGRFADRIVVLSDGQVVESGTHADLLGLGPDRSLYAKQWNEMM